MPYIESWDLPLVETDEDVEILAKVGQDDIVVVDTALSQLIEEVVTVQKLCEERRLAASLEREITLEEIDELNKP